MKSSQKRKVRWSPQENARLAEMWGTSPRYLIEAALPIRTWGQIMDHASRQGLSKPMPGRMSDDERARRKREGMRRQRENPEKRAEINARSRDRYRNDPAVKQRARDGMVAYRLAHLFAYKSRHYADVTAKDLWSLWKRQRGRCALTGRKLGRDAHLDHKTARSRGGDDSLANLQFLCPDANYLKRHMTNEEVLGLCRDFVGWADRQQEVADLSVLRLKRNGSTDRRIELAHAVTAHLEAAG